jgi:anaphase-promoting complex subunit 4
MALGLSTQELEALNSTVNCLQFLAHNILISVNLELRQFTAFSVWLHREIEVQSTEPNSASLDESMENDANIDHISVLDYIQGPMSRSRLADFFNLQMAHDTKPKWDLAAEGSSLYELYKKEFKTANQSISVGRQTPGLNALIVHLEAQCDVVFARIAETQRRHVRFGSPIPLGKGFPTSLDMRMVMKVSGKVGSSSLKRLICGPLH